MIEELKQWIASSKTFDLELAFGMIDDWNYGYIDRKNLKSFFRKHGHVASNQECVSIIRRLDLDADARLSLKEFIDGLTPNEPYSKCLKRIEINQQTRRANPAMTSMPEEPPKALKKSGSVKRSMTPSKTSAFIVKDCQMFGSNENRKSRHRDAPPASSKPKIKNYHKRSKSAKARKPQPSAKAIRHKKLVLYEKLRKEIIEKFGKENVQKPSQTKQADDSDDKYNEVSDFVKLSSKRRERRHKSAQKSNRSPSSKDLLRAEETQRSARSLKARKTKTPKKKEKK